jgi:hypothetical protein
LNLQKFEQIEINVAPVGFVVRFGRHGTLRKISDPSQPENLHSSFAGSTGFLAAETLNAFQLPGNGSGCPLDVCHPPREGVISYRIIKAILDQRVFKWIKTFLTFLGEH